MSCAEASWAHTRVSGGLCGARTARRLGLARWPSWRACAPAVAGGGSGRQVRCAGQLRGRGAEDAASRRAPSRPKGTVAGAVAARLLGSLSAAVADREKGGCFALSLSWVGSCEMLARVFLALRVFSVKNATCLKTSAEMLFGRVLRFSLESSN